MTGLDKTALEPTARDALQAIANLPTGASEYVMEGQEQAYRAVEALFEERPFIEQTTAPAVTEEQVEAALNVDALAQEIRRVDGNHSLGAGQLAEALMPFLEAALSQPVEAVSTGCKDRHGSLILLGDKVRYRLEGSHTKEEYWNPEYEVVFEPPCFTLRHIGGGKDGGNHLFKLRSGGINNCLEIIERGPAHPTPSPAVPDAGVVESGEETVTIDGRTYRKFIRYPEEVDDDTLRCIACGQIDEQPWHDESLCYAKAEASDEPMRWFLSIIDAMGGTADASDGGWANAFCESYEGRDPDTFNRAVDAGYTTTSFNYLFETTTVYLTDKGRAFIAAARRRAR